MKSAKRIKLIAKFMAAVLTLGTVVGVAAGCKKPTPNTESDLEIALWEAGNGRVFMDRIIAEFKKEHPEISVYLSSNADVQTSDLSSGGEINSIDLYFTNLEDYLGYKEYLEPLDDILDETVDGVALSSKFDANILDCMSDPEDGTMYVLPWSSSVGGLVYNASVFEERGYEIPRTTNELKGIVEDAISKKDEDSSQPSPFLHLAEYWNYLLFAWQAQYDGVENFYDAWQFTYDGEQNRVESLTGGASAVDEIEQIPADERGGRYKSLEVLYELISPAGAVYNGTNSFDFTTSQTLFLDGRALMMPNGSWIENEMRQYVTEDTNISMMKTPVISSLAPKLGITENQLSVIVKEIDGLELTASEENLYNSLKENKAEAVAYVESIRNVAYTEQTQFHSFIPNYAVAKDAAKEFLKFFFSDKALQICYETTHMPQSAKMTTGSPDTEGWSDFSKVCLELHDNMTMIVKYLTNPIFYRGNVSNLYYNSPARSFSASGEADKKDLEEYWVWESSYWLNNWDTLLDLAGLKTNA